MSDKTGLDTEGLPKGPEMSAAENVQVQDAPAPGLESELNPRPVVTGIPTALSGREDIKLMEYRGVDKLHNKKAIITGGDSGIGRAVAVMFAREGADIAIVYLPKEEGDAQETKKMVEKEGRTCITMPLDISKEENCEQIVRQAVEKFGRVDVLVNNAAVQVMGPIEETSRAKLDLHFSTNIYPMFLLTKAALPHMSRGSCIINSTSVTAYQGYANLLEYSSTKGAIVSFTRSLSKALVDRGIRVNAVAPGPVHTPLNPASREEQNLQDWFSKEVPPVGHIAHPSEIGPSYVFLAAGESTQFTGQVLHPNGGHVING